VGVREEEEELPPCARMAMLALPELANLTGSVSGEEVELSKELVQALVQWETLLSSEEKGGGEESADLVVPVSAQQVCGAFLGVIPHVREEVWFVFLDAIRMAVANSVPFALDLVRAKGKGSSLCDVFRALETAESFSEELIDIHSVRSAKGMGMLLLQHLAAVLLSLTSVRSSDVVPLTACLTAAHAIMASPRSELRITASGFLLNLSALIVHVATLSKRSLDESLFEGAMQTSQFLISHIETELNDSVLFHSLLALGLLLHRVPSLDILAPTVETAIDLDEIILRPTSSPRLKAVSHELSILLQSSTPYQ